MFVAGQTSINNNVQVARQATSRDADPDLQLRQHIQEQVQLMYARADRPQQTCFVPLLG